MKTDIIKLIEDKIEDFKENYDRKPTKLYLPRHYEDDIFISMSEKGKPPGISAVYGFREEIKKNHGNKIRNLDVIWDASELKVE